MKRKLEQSKKPILAKRPLPKPVQQVKANTYNLLSHQLDAMLIGCDDLFFNLSGRAKSNAEQNLYFESLREIRLKKGGLTANFKRNLDQQYQDLMAPFDLSDWSFLEIAVCIASSPMAGLLI